MRSSLTDADKQRIEAVVSAIEARTSAELAIVVARRSHDYAAYPFLWAAALALLAGSALAVLFPNALPIEVVLLEGGVLAAVYLLLHFTPLGLALTPAGVKEAQARRLAAAKFASLVARRTEDRAGVLLFVSVAEHYVEILADRAVDRRIGREQWPLIVERFRAASGRSLADRIVAAAEACAEILARSLPPKPDQRNEIPDALREI
jgi:putative membrane protein